MSLGSAATVADPDRAWEAVRAEIARPLAERGPHTVPIAALPERADAAGLRFERRIGGNLDYFASPPASAPHSAVRGTKNA